MKKSKLFIACFIGIVLMASYKKTPVAPTISIVSGEGYLTENAQIYANEETQLGFTVTGEKLVELEVKVTKDGILDSHYTDNIDEQSSYTSTKSICFVNPGTLTVTATVTDAAGQTATTSFNFYCVEKPNAKFIGRYEGDFLVSGNFIVNSETMAMENEPFATVVDIKEGENTDEVVADITLNGQTNAVKGKVEGNKVVFNVGFSHNVPVEIPQGITAKADGGLELTVTGIDKELVGQFAANLRDIKRPDPYHIYGIRYKDEVIVKKVGKTAGK